MTSMNDLGVFQSLQICTTIAVSDFTVIVNYSKDSNE